MELEKKKNDAERKENDIVYSRAIKAGKRIYYLDVKRSKNNDFFVAITESKKKVFGADDNDVQVTYEKHKIFLYKEDFDKFIEGLEDVVGFVKQEKPFVNQADKSDKFPADLPADEEPEQPAKKGFFNKFRI